ncbi:helix-turn-helix domain-containing protein [Bacillus sp. IITD106]|nr:helix-turn-helix domain-containing protein [Bacillus sp. IITD106]
MDSFGWRLENLREKKGYTKKEMSLRLGFTENVYGQYEREVRRPSLETITKLAEIFNVSLDYLIRGEEYRQNTNSTQKEQELLEIVSFCKEKGIDDLCIFQPKKWVILSKEDIKEINDHFEWVVQKAEVRSKEVLD